MKGIGCPLDSEHCEYLCKVQVKASRCLEYDDANLCSKARAKKKRMRRHTKRMIEKGRYWWCY